MVTERDAQLNPPERLGRFISVKEADATRLRQVSSDLAALFSSTEDPDLLMQLPTLSHELPRDLVAGVTEFRLRDQDGLTVVKGLHVDQRQIGPTPSDWRAQASPSRAFVEELTLLLVASLLGEPFGWRTQQDGHLIHEVFPIREDETAQLGTSSDVLLTWHTEDAFHPYRADYVLIQALRNPDKIPTTVGRLDPNRVNPQLLEVLFQERFIIRPDNSHLAKYNTNQGQGTEADFREIERMAINSKPEAVLFGSPTSPYVRLDPYFMEVHPGDELAAAALKEAVAAIDASLFDVVLEPGDILILDNLRVVHGRRPFRARYDGSDRWLKRVNVTRDIRKSRQRRPYSECRLIA